MMKKIVTFVLGVCFFINGLLDLSNGATIGFGTLAGGGRIITVENSLIEFYLAIIFQLGLGAYLIKVALLKKELD